jgi:hypothetical protein
MQLLKHAGFPETFHQCLCANAMGIRMQKRAMALRAVLWPMLLMAIAAPASAHHSFAGYDMSKTSNAQATIKEFRWGAPHSAAVFVIKGSDGKQQEVTVASAAPRCS